VGHNGRIEGGEVQELLVVKQTKLSQGEHRQRVLQVSTLARPIAIIFISVVVVECQQQCFQSIRAHGLTIIIPEQQLKLYKR
jgi:hypothetical protein